MEQHLITANQANALLAYLERQPLTLQIQALAQMVQNLPVVPVFPDPPSPSPDPSIAVTEEQS